MKPDVFKRKALESLQSFDPGLVIRGVQLTFVGAYRALQNPNLFQNQHYKQAAGAILAGLVVKLLVDLPMIGVKLILFFGGFVYDLKASHWDERVLSGIDFIEKNVLQLPFFLMTLTSWHLTNSLDDMFMESLKWVDKTYMHKHEHDGPSNIRDGYYQNLALWGETAHRDSHVHDKSQTRNSFINRAVMKGAISLAVYCGSLIPVLGRLVLPAATAYSIHAPAGIGPSITVFVAAIFIPRHRMVVVLQAYYASRSLTRQLLEPYFSRIYFTPPEKKKWFRERQGLLFGFGLGFYLLLRIPFLGILIYGIAEAATAYLITKVTDPPPHPSQGFGFAASQAVWKEKSSFRKLSGRNLELSYRDMVGEKIKPELQGGTQFRRNREAEVSKSQHVPDLK